MVHHLQPSFSELRRCRIKTNQTKLELLLAPVVWSCTLPGILHSSVTTSASLSCLMQSHSSMDSSAPPFCPHLETQVTSPVNSVLSRDGESLLMAVVHLTYSDSSTTTSWATLSAQSASQASSKPQTFVSPEQTAAVPAQATVVVHSPSSGEAKACTLVSLASDLASDVNSTGHQSSLAQLPS